MSLKVAIQMDPVAGIDIRGDTTFALGLEAQRRGHELFVYDPEHLTMSLKHGAAPKDSVTATGRATRFIDDRGGHYQEGEPETRALINQDVVLMRQDPPFDMHYITATHLLDHIHPDTLVVNNPTEVRNAPEKLLVTSFPELLPPTLISRNTDDIRAFRDEHKNIIVKPLFGNGGAGIFHLTPDDSNLSSLLEMMLAQDRAPLMIQQYLPDVRKGDKRVILVDGKPVGALNRLPAEGESRSNMHVGGQPAEIDLDDDDFRIAEAIGPLLNERGLLFTGIDVIGGYLTEINVTSPTGIREIERFTGVNLAATIWDAIEEKL
ncbi:MAG: glutathione synthase [Alphaproteobacteria bacterium]|nr:glutathione synthase [Alphaproteobacteria bacterium]